MPQNGGEVLEHCNLRAIQRSYITKRIKIKLKQKQKNYCVFLFSINTGTTVSISTNAY